ncbi:hypothetical protein N1851_021812 [Merluccius polli]|uniref:Uncharacterized protein n=1 Tax=Merluccius polli TaxID=89951 RepID=A0AA47MJF7_MERPO|nr:hypothetical protein N1851_021812 [Merluccius polli]
MFQQDEEQAEDLQQQTLELLSGDILNCENGFQEGPQRTLVEASPAATETATEDASPARVLQDHNMEDDLELLFDEPTQHISENLSQYGLFGSMETSSFNSMAARGPTCCPTPAVSTHAKDSPAGNRLDDDWENDDFLNDSLVIEMTQNPLNFAPPKHCSTQRGSDVTLHGRKYPSRGTPGKLGGAAQNEPRIPKNRTTFKLDANPQFSLPIVVTGAATNQASVSNAGTHTVFGTPQGEALSRRNRPVSGSQLKRHSQPSAEDVSNAPTVPQSQTSLTDGSAQRNSAVTAPPIPSNTMKENQPVRSSNIQATINPSAVHKERQTLPVALASDDFLDEDLDDLFSTEPVWDDEGDDDLLCKMCDDLESQAEAPGQTGQRPTPLAASAKVGDNRKGHLDVNVLKDTWPSTPPTTAAPQAAGHLRSLPEHVTPTPLAAQPARPSVDSFAGNTLSNIKATRMDSHRYGPPEQSSCRVSNVGNSQCYGGGPSLKTRAGDEGQFTFKKPPGPSVRVINTGEV